MNRGRRTTETTSGRSIDDGVELLKPTNRSSTMATRLALLILVASTFAAFGGVTRNGFVDWDDKNNLVRNDAFKGFGTDNLHWMFSTGFAGHYQPLTWLSFALESQLWGIHPAGCHIINVVLHALTAVGFFFLSRRLIGLALGMEASTSLTVGAMAASLLFAIHPLRVESVVWATERRDVLSGVWLVAAVIFYVRYASPLRRDRRGGAWAMALLCYVLSLLSKAAGITLPLVLLALDFFPLRRLGPGADPDRRITWRRCLTEKLMFLIPAMASAGMALWAQRDTGALRTLTEHSVGLRIAQAFYGIVFYLYKTLWPFQLIPLYEQRPEATPLEPVHIMSALVVLGVTVLLIFIRRRRPGLLTAWVAYLALLAPVLGIAQSGPQVVADRYSYLSCMAWAVVLGGGVSRLWQTDTRHAARTRVLVGGALVGVFITLGILTRQQVRIWRDSHTLWSHVVAIEPRTGVAHANLAVLYNGRGEYELGLASARRALAILPGNRTAHIALARASLELGDLDAAEQHLKTALHIQPDDAAAWIRLAITHTRQGRFDEAEACYRKAISLDPENAEWPFNLAGFLASRKRYDEALDAFAATLQIDPGYPSAAFRAGVLKNRMGDVAGAVALWERGLTHAPDDRSLRTKLAWCLATSPIEDIHDGARAVVIARGLVNDAPAPAIRAREVLAAALARSGDFARASDLATRILDEHATDLDETTRIRLQKALAGYRNGEPYTEPATQ